MSDLKTTKELDELGPGVSISDSVIQAKPQHRRQTRTRSVARETMRNAIKRTKVRVRYPMAFLEALETAVAM